MARELSRLLLITSSVGLVLLALITCGDAAPVLPTYYAYENRVQLLSWLTGRYLTVSSTDNSIHADGSVDDSDTHIIMEMMSDKTSKFKREGSDTYITVTPAGELKGIDDMTSNGSVVFTLTSELLYNVLYYKLSTTVQYSMPTLNSTDIDCYIAVDDIDTGEPPANVCDVTDNDFPFDDVESLLFYIDHLA